jgi:hypothetical protein
MASYTYTQLYGSGSIGEDLTINVEKIFTFTNPSGSSYFTMESKPTSTGFFEGTSPKNFSGSFVTSASMGLVTSSYIASIVVQPGTQSFKFTPAITVTGTTYRLRGTGAYSLEISSGGVSAPVNTVAPEVTFNNLYVGGILTTTNGTWTGSPTFTYQWFNVSTGDPIAGATNSTYTLLSSNAGTEINCKVTGTNAAGSGDGFSNVINSLPLAAPTNIESPFIDEGTTYYLGSTIVFTGNVWDGNPVPVLTYRWLRNFVEISGATNNTYDAISADVNNTISVRCTATNSQGTDFVESNGVFIEP